MSLKQPAKAQIFFFFFVFMDGITALRDLSIFDTPNRWKDVR